MDRTPKNNFGLEPSIILRLKKTEFKEVPGHLTNPERMISKISGLG